MIDPRETTTAPDAPVLLDLATITETLTTIETLVNDDTSRADLIRSLEALTCAATGAQAALAVDLADSQIAAQVRAGEPRSRRGQGVAAQVALARRESVHRGTFHLGLARLVLTDLPHVTRAWRAGRISEYRVQKIAAQACVLARPERLTLDTRLAGTPELVETLERMGDRTTERTAAQIAYDLDKHAVIARRARATTERHTSLRPAPDGMTWFTALLPLIDGVAVHASLTQAATRARGLGDDRTQGQVMADTLVDRVTGRTDDTPIPIHVEIVIPVDVATGTGDHADAACWTPAYGPVPADLARQWAHTAAQDDAATYTRIWADAPTGHLIGTESRSQSRTYPAALAAHARRRDQVCRIPWCDAPVKHIDHSVAAAQGGETSIQNAGGLCEAHNYAKEAHGWSAETSRDPDGTHVITYTTPTGHTYDSRPPPAYPPRE